jgi:Polyketide cyclase / dehydrase and lipid transport
VTSREDVTVVLDRDSVTATAVAAAPPSVVFDILRRPANHQAINGDGTVHGPLDGPEVLELGSRFGMRMRLGVPYRIHSRVVACEPDHLLAWRHLGGHEWRWALEPTADGTTTVSETFDLSTSRFPGGLRLVGYPARHRDNVAGSVAKLVDLVARRA